MSSDNTISAALALRPRRAAEALGVSERLLWEWTHRCGLPHLRIGRTVLYPTDALREWLLSRSRSEPKCPSPGEGSGS